ncbi:GET1 [Candida theae]|uniref:Golgi to ER traffic protein 1 n=1 Tax=Candida theae TaxID=1198502 RepID=A0AAD5BDC3_9ASCO|nr:GET1 [Candida theae]KAI5957477.1 GET1 [Candida theae]
MASFDLSPYTIIITTFTLLLLQKLISVISKPTIQSLVWNIYSSSPLLAQSKSIKQYAAKQHEIRTLTHEQRLISAQDEYARWTKLNRKLDKLKVELQELNESLGSEKARVNSLTNSLIWISTVLPIWVMRFLFRKTQLFYIRAGILPHYLEWWLALPFSQTGAIGLTCWMFAVNYVLSEIFFVVSFPFQNKVAKPEKPIKGEGQDEN